MTIVFVVSNSDLGYENVIDVFESRELAVDKCLELDPNWVEFTSPIGIHEKIVKKLKWKILS